MVEIENSLGDLLNHLSGSPEPLSHNRHIPLPKYIQNPRPAKLHPRPDVPHIDVLSKEQADEFRLKTAIFKSATKTSKHAFFTLLTTFPIIPNEHSLSTVDIALDMNCLFETF